MTRILTLIVVAVLAIAVRAREAAAKPEEALDLALREQAEASMNRGAEFLLKSQNPDGSWGEHPQPAIAALCAMALHQSPLDPERKDPAVDKAMKYVLSFTEDDGAVHGKAQRRFLFFKGSRYPNYTTAIALLAMETIGKKEWQPLMRAARDFLKSAQVADPQAAAYGGWGYDQGKRADLSNTAWTAEALHVTAYLDEEPEGDADERARTKAMWSALDSFLKDCQVRAAEAAEGEDLGHGGFAYKPGDLVATGSMTYAGLKSMIYARLDRDDPRVKGAMAFIREHYTVDENPGAGMDGLYYYLQTMAKALDVYGENPLPVAGGKPRNWRADIANKFIGMQRDNGCWFNEQGRYLESMPALATAYALISLEVAAGRLSTAKD